MNKTKQRISIGTRHGWKLKFLEAVGPAPGTPYGYTDSVMGYFPDYLNDLNAMHSAILFTMNSTELRNKYSDELYGVVSRTTQIGNGSFWMENATAAQCAEALLKTIDEWE